MSPLSTHSELFCSSILQARFSIPDSSERLSARFFPLSPPNFLLFPKQLFILFSITVPVIPPPQDARRDCGTCLFFSPVKVPLYFGPPNNRGRCLPIRRVKILNYLAQRMSSFSQFLLRPPLTMLPSALFITGAANPGPTGFFFRQSFFDLLSQPPISSRLEAVADVFPRSLTCAIS